MISSSELATSSDSHQDLDEQLGQLSVKVQSAIYQSNITNKDQLLQILGQLSVKVWDKSKKSIDKAQFCQSTIDLIEFLNNVSTSTIKEIVEFLKYSDTTELRRKIVNPLISLGYISMTNPDKPTSSKQKYRLTTKGQELFK